MNESQKTALRDILTKLASIPRPGVVFEGRGRRKFITAEYVANKHGFDKAHITRVLKGDTYRDYVGYTAPLTKRRVVNAIAQEATEAGIEFPVELFEEYLTHDGSPFMASK